MYQRIELMNVNKGLKGSKPPKFILSDKWVFHTEYPFIIFYVKKGELITHTIKDEAPDFLVAITQSHAEAWYKEATKKQYTL